MTDLLGETNIKLLLACWLINKFVLSMNFLMVPLFTLTLSDSHIVLALVVGAFPLVGILLSLVSGVLCDYLGRRIMIIVSFVFQVSACLLFAAASSYHLLLLGQVALGLADVFFWIAGLALLTELAPLGRQYTLQGLGTALMGLGRVLGPIVGGYATRFVGFTAAFLVGGALAFSGLIIATRIESMPSPDVHIGRFLARLVEYHKGAWQLLRHSTAVLWGTLAWTMMMLTWPTLGQSFYLEFLIASGFSSSSVGSLTSARLLVGLLAQLSFAYVGSRTSMVSVMLASILISALTVAVTPLLGNLPLIAVAGCLAGVAATHQPAVISFLAENTNQTERATSFSLLNLSWALTTPTALLILGVIAEGVSLASTFFLTGLFVISCGGLLWVWASRMRL